MKFKIKDTKTTLEPSDKSVSEAYASRPEVYDPIDAEAKALVEKLFPKIAKDEPDTDGN